MAFASDHRRQMVPLREEMRAPSLKNGLFDRRAHLNAANHAHEQGLALEK
jgi:hypothetical protein